MRYAALVLSLSTSTLACNFGVDPFENDSGDVGGNVLADDGDDDDGNADGGPGGAGPVDGGPGPDDGDGDDGMVDTGAMDDGGTDTGGTDDGQELLCLPKPQRVIIFGDSIFACFPIGKASDDCSAKIVAEYVSDSYGPATYENLAVNGDRTKHVPDNQMPNMMVGPGHALVVIFIGGNDLAQYIFSSDAEAQAGWDTTGAEVAQKWEEIFAFLDDPANFPDGVTLLMNTQYNPFDDCTAAPYASVTPLKTMLLHQHNDALVERASSRDYAFIADQHPSFLGHGHHYDKPECPHYIEGAGPWMFDMIHTNVAGHHQLAAEMRKVIDSLYAGC